MGSWGDKLWEGKHMGKLMEDEGYLVRFVVQTQVSADFLTPMMTVFFLLVQKHGGGGVGEAAS